MADPNMTAPYQARVETDLRQPLRHVQTVEAWADGWAAPVPLAADEVSVTFDEGWAPHVQAEVVAKVPGTQAELDQLDPRRLVRLRCSAGYVYPGGYRDVHPLFDLGLRTRPVARPDNNMAMTAASDEALVQDAGPWVDGFYNINTLDLSGHVAHVLPLVLGRPQTIVDELPPGPYINAWMSGSDNVWQTVTSWVNSRDAWLHDDGLRRWRLRPRPVDVGPVAHELRTGPAGTLTNARTSVSREADEWANYVQVLHVFTDAQGLEQSSLGRAWVSSGPYQGWDEANSTPLPGLKWWGMRLDTPATLAEATTAAKAILRRKLRGGRSMTLEAPAAYWLRPGHTVAVQLPLGPPELHLVSAVTFRLRTGSMTVTTRHPESTPIATGA